MWFWYNLLMETVGSSETSVSTGEHGLEVSEGHSFLPWEHALLGTNWVHRSWKHIERRRDERLDISIGKIQGGWVLLQCSSPWRRSVPGNILAARQHTQHWLHLLQTKWCPRAAVPLSLPGQPLALLLWSPSSHFRHKISLWEESFSDAVGHSSGQDVSHLSEVE